MRNQVQTSNRPRQCTLEVPDCGHVSKDSVARIVRECLDHGTAVEIEGLGVFQPLECGDCEFLAYTQPRIFIAYVDENFDSALRFYDDMTARGYGPWIDKKKLLPGQNWPRAIEQAIDVSDFVVFLFSGHGVSKPGGFQKELRYALECARRLPLETVFLIPARLEECAVPSRITKELQYVDLFPDWDKGVRRIAGTMERQMLATNRRPRAA
ncbi:MAG: toll/interleukin-1 receptor domain-containing protein [Bryobacteraceae bacterium]